MVIPCSPFILDHFIKGLVRIKQSVNCVVTVISQMASQCQWSHRGYVVSITVIMINECHYGGFFGRFHKLESNYHHYEHLMPVMAVMCNSRRAFTPMFMTFMCDTCIWHKRNCLIYWSLLSYTPLHFEIWFIGRSLGISHETKICAVWFTISLWLITSAMGVTAYAILAKISMS